MEVKTQPMSQDDDGHIPYLISSIPTHDPYKFPLKNH